MVELTFQQHADSLDINKFTLMLSDGSQLTATIGQVINIQKDTSVQLISINEPSGTGGIVTPYSVTIINAQTQTQEGIATTTTDRSTLGTPLEFIISQNTQFILYFNSGPLPA